MGRGGAGQGVMGWDRIGYASNDISVAVQHAVTHACCEEKSTVL